MEKTGKMGKVLLLSAAVVTSSVLVFAQPDRDAFFAELHRATQAGDRAAIAGMIRYPITVAIGGVRLPIADASTFLARYDDIFTPELLAAIARKTGDVHIERVDGQHRITAISVPPHDPTAQPAAMPDSVSATAARKPETRRIAIRVGPRPTQIPGTLLRDSIDTFVLYLPKGKLVSIRLERVPAGTASIRVVHARTGAPLGARVSADGRFVSGRPAEDGDYRIEVQRTGGDDGHVPYMLSLSLR